MSETYCYFLRMQYRKFILIFTKKQDREKLIFFKNAGYLTLVQIFNFIFPFMTLAYLSTTLGLTAFGQLILIQTISAFAIALSEFGLSWSGVRELSFNRDNPCKRTELYSSFLIINIGCTIISCSFIITMHSLKLIPLAADIIFGGVILIISAVALPPWLLLGLEEIKTLTLFTVINKILYLILLLFFVSGPEHVGLAITLQGLSIIFVGSIIHFHMLRKKLISFKLIDGGQIVKCIKTLTELFLAQIYTVIYGNIAPLTLGLFGYVDELGLFNVADRIQKATRVLLNPITSAALPRITAMRIENKLSARKFANNILFFVTLLIIFVSVLAYYSAEFLIILIAGDDFFGSVILLKFFLIVPTIITLSTVLGTQLLLPFSFNEEFRKSLECGLWACLITLIPCIYIWQALGCVINVIITESVVTISMANAAYKRNLLWKK